MEQIIKTDSTNEIAPSAVSTTNPVESFNSPFCSLPPSDRVCFGDSGGGGAGASERATDEIEINEAAR